MRFVGGLGGGQYNACPDGATSPAAAPLPSACYCPEGWKLLPSGRCVDCASATTICDFGTAPPQEQQRFGVTYLVLLGSGNEQEDPMMAIIHLVENALVGAVVSQQQQAAATRRRRHRHRRQLLQIASTDGPFAYTVDCSTVARIQVINYCNPTPLTAVTVHRHTFDI